MSRTPTTSSSTSTDANGERGAVRPRALVVEDDRSERDALVSILGTQGFEAVTAAKLGEARNVLKTCLPELVLLDLALPDGNGIDLLHELRSEPWIEVVPLAVRADVSTAVDALRCGATDYLTKPLDHCRLESLLGEVRERAVRRNGEVHRLRDQLGQLGRFGSMVGTSEPMQRVYELIGQVAPTDATVLLHGESGTGKELAAETLHRLSSRSSETFLPVNCSALSPDLVESELFGHERGSFTGASKRRRGYFEVASRGTLFLDEITEMPIGLQVKLLRVLESGTIRRVGGDREIAVDARIIAATNRDPEEAVHQNMLREDLHYRLQVFPIELPPLRHRGGDIELLANYFVEELNRSNSAHKTISSGAIERLLAWSWPGNVRELKNVLERAFILAETRIEPSCLPATVTGAGPRSGRGIEIRVGTGLDEARRVLTLATFTQMDGNKTRTAAKLGISVKTLNSRLREYERQEQQDAN